jgi:hypothetical protein
MDLPVHLLRSADGRYLFRGDAHRQSCAALVREPRSRAESSSVGARAKEGDLGRE